MPIPDLKTEVKLVTYVIQLAMLGLAFGQNTLEPAL